MSERQQHGELARRRFADNPFYVLGLRPDSTRAEVEREGKKLLAMLEVKLSAGESHTSPLGTHTRSAEQIREAMAELRDPERRLVHELWARLAPPTEPSEPASDMSDTQPDGDSHPGFVLLGFRRKTAR